MSNLTQRKQRLLALCLLWGLLLAVLALQPERLVEVFLPVLVMRDIAHVLTYGVFAFFIALYLRFRRHLFGLSMTFLNAAFLAFALTVAWGGFTEWIQQFEPSRTVSLKDLAYDVLGAFAGVVVFVWRDRT